MRRQFSYFAVLLFSLLLGTQVWSQQRKPVASVTQSSGTEKRVALVIGNSAYQTSPLRNPSNDATDMAGRLRELGFEVIERNNITVRQIGGTLREFRQRLSPGAVALVFYAGHGLQIRGENYLPTVDGDINSEEDVPNQSISMKQIMDVLDESKTRLNLVFLDACRNNPYARNFRSADQGLARVSAPSGTLISYATRPGSVASDGTGRNGLYTGELLRQMQATQAPIEQVLKRVVSSVKNSSKGKQEPWMEGSIEGDFCFGGCNADAAETAKPGRPPMSSAPRPVPGDDPDTALWNAVQAGNSVDDYRVYMQQYPKGKYVALARQRLQKLQDEQAAIELAADEAAWKAAEASGNEAAYQGYLVAYPRGRYAALVAPRIAKLKADAAIREENQLWSQAQEATSSGPVQAYLDRYPTGRFAAAANLRLVEVNRIEAELVPLSWTPAAGAASATASNPTAAAQSPASTATPGAVAASAVSGSEDELAWAWPTAGVVIAGFDENRNKGLDIGGSAGDPVLAAADGRAVYVGAGLRGYGNFIILKHNNTYLTAYAHNRTLLIKEDQSVRKGQKIAEMGSSDADRVKLHFEIRRQGKSVDPARYLPPR
jgi:uncharacterized caspase-like protein